MLASILAAEVFLYVIPCVNVLSADRSAIGEYFRERVFRAPPSLHVSRAIQRSQKLKIDKIYICIKRASISCAIAPLLHTHRAKSKDRDSSRKIASPGKKREKINERRSIERVSTETRVRAGTRKRGCTERFSPSRRNDDVRLHTDIPPKTDSIEIEDRALPSQFTIFDGGRGSTTRRNYARFQGRTVEFDSRGRKKGGREGERRNNDENSPLRAGRPPRVSFGKWIASARDARRHCCARRE